MDAFTLYDWLTLAAMLAFVYCYGWVQGHTHRRREELAELLARRG